MMTTLGELTLLRLSVFVVSSCASRSDESAGLRLDLEQISGMESEPEEAIFAEVGDVAIADARNVYVTDGQDNRLVTFDPSSNMLWSAGREPFGRFSITKPKTSRSGRESVGSRQDRLLTRDVPQVGARGGAARWPASGVEQRTTESASIISKRLDRELETVNETSPQLRNPMTPK